MAYVSGARSFSSSRALEHALHISSPLLSNYHLNQIDTYQYGRGTHNIADWYLFSTFGYMSKRIDECIGEFDHTHDTLEDIGCGTASFFWRMIAKNSALVPRIYYGIDYQQEQFQWIYSRWIEVINIQQSGVMPSFDVYKKTFSSDIGFLGKMLKHRYELFDYKILKNFIFSLEKVSLCPIESDVPHLRIVYRIRGETSDREFVYICKDCRMTPVSYNTQSAVLLGLSEHQERFGDFLQFLSDSIFENSGIQTLIFSVMRSEQRNTFNGRIQSIMSYFGPQLFNAQPPHLYYHSNILSQTAHTFPQFNWRVIPSFGARCLVVGRKKVL